MDTQQCQQILETLEKNYSELATQLEGIPDELAGRRPAEKEWSIKETLGHLLVCEEYAHTRLVRMVHETNPYLPAFNDHELLGIRRYHETNAQELLNTFLAFGKENLALLRSLSVEEWDRTGNHEERGTITVAYIAEKMLAEHHREHLGQIQDLKQWLQQSATPER